MQNRTIIEPDDFKNDLFITVHSLKPQKTILQQSNSIDESGGNIIATAASIPPPSCCDLCGVVLQIKGMQLPYLLVEMHGPNSLKQIIHLDTRSFNFMKLNNDYVFTLLGKNPSNAPKNTNEYPPFGCAPVFFPITEIVKPSKLKSPKVSKQRKKKK